MARDKYLEARVMTSSPEQLHLMVVDHAIQFAGRARVALETQDFGTSHEALNRCRDLVIELINGLHPTRWADLTERLKELFSFVLRNLAKADSQHNSQSLDDALEILKIHRSNWLDLVILRRQEATNELARSGRTSWAV